MKKKVGLALGAGAVRGLAHLGVLEILNEAQIPVDFIAGTSIGAMIGGLYCSGQDIKQLSRLAVSLNWEHLTDFALPKKGLIRGKRILELLMLLTKGKEFSDLKIPFAAVACDLERGEEVVIERGSVAEAIRASISIPGIFVPHRLEGKLLVDGAVLNRVPANIVKDRGLDVIIAVDVGFMGSEITIKNIFDVIMNSIDIMQNEIMKQKMVNADILIKPEVGHISSSSLNRAGECIEAGRIATKEMLDDILKCLEG